MTLLPITFLFVQLGMVNGIHQEPAKIDPAILGTWQEPLKPGEDTAVRYRISFSEHVAMIRKSGQLMIGSIATRAKPDGDATLARDARPPELTITIVHIIGDGPFTIGDEYCLFLVDGTKLFLRFDPSKRGASSGSDGKLRLAPVNLKLEKVKK